MRRGKTRGPGWILDNHYRHPKARRWAEPGIDGDHMNSAWVFRVRDGLSITDITRALGVDRLFVCNSLDLRRAALIAKVPPEQRKLLEQYQSLNIGDADRKRRCVDRALASLVESPLVCSRIESIDIRTVIQ